MTFVVVDNCIRCKYTDCVEVCPVDCFYEGPNFLVEINDELSRVWPNITEKKDSLPDAEEWDGVPNKLDHLDRG